MVKWTGVMAPALEYPVPNWNIYPVIPSYALCHAIPWVKTKRNGKGMNENQRGRYESVPPDVNFPSFI